MFLFLNGYRINLAEHQVRAERVGLCDPIVAANLPERSPTIGPNVVERRQAGQLDKRYQLVLIGGGNEESKRYNINHHNCVLYARPRVGVEKANRIVDGQIAIDGHRHQAKRAGKNTFAKMLTCDINIII